MICCEREVMTKFCPHCGKSINGDAPIQLLLSHCRASEKAKRSRASSLRTGDCTESHGGAASETRQRWADGADKNADKWKLWGDALLALIEATKGDSHE